MSTAPSPPPIMSFSNSADLEMNYPEDPSFTFSETAFMNSSNTILVEPEDCKKEGDKSCDSVKIALKFLLSNVAAGIVIGKAGTNIMHLQVFTF